MSHSSPPPDEVEEQEEQGQFNIAEFFDDWGRHIFAASLIPIVIFIIVAMVMMGGQGDRKETPKTVKEPIAASQPHTTATPKEGSRSTEETAVSADNDKGTKND